MAAPRRPGDQMPNEPANRQPEPGTATQRAYQSSTSWAAVPAARRNRPPTQGRPRVATPAQIAPSIKHDRQLSAITGTIAKIDHVMLRLGNYQALENDERVQTVADGRTIAQEASDLLDHLSTRDLHLAEDRERLLKRYLTLMHSVSGMAPLKHRPGQRRRVTARIGGKPGWWARLRDRLG